MVNGLVDASEHASTADAVLASYIEDFRDGVALLRKSEGERHLLTARKLCELSRDIRFRLSPPDRGQKQLVEYIVALFREAAEAIRVPEDHDEAEAYCSNITDRAGFLEGRK